MESAAPSGGGPGGYAESIDSMSPRSRGGESWDDSFPPSANVAAAAQLAGGGGGAKLRLMCSYGGQIVPRPHDRTLCYLGGETRIVVMERHSTLGDLHGRLSRYVGGRHFCVKYQLPSEDLDSLISVTTDEDLENMIEEYDRVAAAAGGGKPLRLRLFLFPAKPESTGTASSIGSLLDDSKSETWFVDALNSAMLGRGRSSVDSVNCLLGIEESKSSTNEAGGGVIPQESDNGVVYPRQDSSGKIGGGGGSRHGGQEIHSVPDSPMLGTFSSFGSASSAPSLSNLPPIRVRSDDRGPERRGIGAGLEEHFAQMNFSDQKLQQQQTDVEGLNSHLQHHPPPPPQLINVVPLTAASAIGANPTNASLAENPNSTKVFSSDDDKSDHGGFRRSSPQHPQQQQPQSAYYQERSSPAADPIQEPPPSDPGFRLPVQVNEKGYLLQQQPALPLPSLQAVEQLQPQQQQSQQQFLQANPHLLHHHAGGAVLPINHYYHQMAAVHSQPQLLQDPHAYNQQVPMYFLPVRQNPAYNLQMQPNLSGDPVAAKPLPGSVLPSGVAPPKQELAGNIYRPGVNAPTAVASQHPQLIHLGADQSHQFVGYPSMHHHRPQSAPGYGYEYADAGRPQQIYYTQAPPAAALPPQYQAMTSATLMSQNPSPALQPPADPKPGKAP
ncbi:unnamed protein product [Spirodela intermedia]|uniref:PB1 domain-containing protein n=1 Tax=Spirodela intermedia TaxID=51605 RepID=A0A7I8LEM0_SPIIN|nr:unnamed protein product [Spirodela intermedia]